MENTEEIISSEDKTLSLFCHLSMVIGGILLPIIIWAIKKDNSKFVRFHSLQSIFFHLVFSVILAVVIIISVAAIVITSTGLATLKNNLEHTSGAPAAFLIIIFGFSLFIFFYAMGGIAYSIYLAIKSYHGDKVRIPVIGKIIYEKVYGKI